MHIIRYGNSSMAKEEAFMRKYLITIILSIIFIGLLIYVVFTYNDKSKSAQNQVLFQIDKTQISSIEYTSKMKMEFKNINNKYTLFVPEEVPSEASKVDDFVNTCTKIEYETLISQNESNLAQFGLSNSQKSITINQKDGSKYSFDIGDKTPTEDGYYIKDNKNNVYKINMDISRIFELKIDDFINKGIITFDKDKLDKIIFTYNGETTFEKINGSWKVNNSQLNQDLVSQLFDKINGIMVDGLLSKEQYLNISKPEIKITAYQGGQVVSEILAVKAKENIYAITKSGILVQYYMSNETLEKTKGDILRAFEQAKIQ